jgi:cyclin B
VPANLSDDFSALPAAVAGTDSVARCTAGDLAAELHAAGGNSHVVSTILQVLGENGEADELRAFLHAGAWFAPAAAGDQRRDPLVLTAIGHASASPSRSRGAEGGLNAAFLGGGGAIASAAATVSGALAAAGVGLGDVDVDIGGGGDEDEGGARHSLHTSPELELSSGYRQREAAYRLEGEVLGNLTDTMWSILVDWMVEVQMNYSLSQETLFLSIDILCRYFRIKQVERCNLQLFGASALLIASKYEEIYPPEVNEFVYICASTYTRQAILNGEKDMLNALGYRLSSPLACHFLNWIGRRVHLERQHLHLAQFLLESTLQERTFARFPRSLVAAAAIDLSGKALKCEQATLDQAASEADFTKEQVRQCAKQLNELVLVRQDERVVNHNLNCRRKYSDAKLDFVGVFRFPKMFY